jgi:hypothetical protein
VEFRQAVAETGRPQYRYRQLFITLRQPYLSLSVYAVTSIVNLALLHVTAQVERLFEADPKLRLIVRRTEKQRMPPPPVRL